MQPLQKFDDCIAFLKERMKKPLPGLQAQLKLAPPFRDNIMPKVMDNYRKGSVMLLIKNIEQFLTSFLSNVLMMEKYTLVRSHFPEERKMKVTRVY